MLFAARDRFSNLFYSFLSKIFVSLTKLLYSFCPYGYGTTARNDFNEVTFSGKSFVRKGHVFPKLLETFLQIEKNLNIKRYNFDTRIIKVKESAGSALLQRALKFNLCIFFCSFDILPITLTV